MKPTKLTISAFGPYGDTQEPLDFTELNGQNIFVITGKTGAGKTTIFDAICYALYGEGSGELRCDAEKLRSDFATTKDETFVELEFELKGEIYKIRRSPTQEKAKQRGEGTTIKKAEAELIMPDGKVVTKPKAVDLKLNEILGITKEQFKQIVMLPQGEFKKLLVAPSKDKEEIFRKIFNTYNYKKIQTKLEDRARDLRKDTEECRTKMSAFISNIKGEHNIQNDEYIDYVKVIYELKELIYKEEKVYEENKKELDILKKESESLKEKKIEAQNNKKLLEDKENIDKKLELLKIKEKDINSKKDILKKIVIAKEIKFKEDKNNEDVDKLKRKEIELETIKFYLETNKVLLETLEMKVKNEEEKEPERKELTIEISKLVELKPKLKELDEASKLVKENIDKQKLLTKNIEKTKKSLEDEKKTKELLEEKVKNIGKLELNKANLESKNKDNENSIKILRNLYDIIDKYEVAVKAHKEKSKDSEARELEYKKIKEVYEKMQETYMKEKAGILAKNLEENKPCPVCGSIDHPNPAVILSEYITEEALEKSKKRFEEIQKGWNEYCSTLEVLNNNIKIFKRDMEEALESFENISYNIDTLSLVKEKGLNLKEEIKNTNNEIVKLDLEIKNKENLEKEIENIINKIKLLELELDKLIKEESNLSGLIGEVKSKYETLKGDIPKELASLNILEDRIKEKESYLKKLEDTLKKVRDDSDKVKTTLNKLESSKIESEKVIQELRNEINTLDKNINKEILEKGFDTRENYEEIKILISNYESINEEIENYKTELNQSIGKQKELDEKCKDIKIIDTTEIDEKLIVLTNKETEIEKAREEEVSILKSNKTMLENIEDLNSRFEDKQKEYKVIGELANTTSGKSAPYISFERYVLASYFEEIIEAANIRLSKMTNNRYKLIRKTDRAKGAGAKGLDLDIIDANTGKERDVTSISGGESFKASLALALGLSDIVQATAGGVSLDTIFIDEGFGTLDEESLESAIATLLELQSAGRLVGVISHRDELKERIGAKIEVSSSIRGSKAKFSIL